MSDAIHSRQSLVDAFGRRDFEEAVRTGAVEKVANGWYAVPGQAATDALRAVRLGGRLGCLSGAAFHGLWVPPTDELHLVMRRPGRRPVVDQRGGRVQVHPVRTWPSDQVACTVADCVGQVLRHHDAETGLIVAESALNLGLLGMVELAELNRGLPARKQRVISRAVDNSQSGSETRVRLFFDRSGVPVRSQVPISGVGIVDLLVGNSLVIECDSRRHHTGESNYHGDRRRDLRLHELRYTVVRLTWEQIFLDWEQTTQVLTGLIRARVHRRQPRQPHAWG
ncbi:endonuclease domain-containing protein [Propionibacteriaceae bacterium Y2011]|uniref:endonuclease domain-containing protein n=1 Tax=Microlunatus sp. Y2014 TaxID=3418488 RepID=UPI003B4C67A4